MPPSYARAGAARALSGGLNNIVGLLMAKRADEEAQELAAYRQNEAVRMQRAAELAQPDVIPLEQGVRDYGITDASLSAISNAAEPTAPIAFEAPAPRSIDVPGGEPMTVRDPAPTVTPYGNVRDSGITRMLARAGEQEGYNLGLQRGQAERDRVAEGLSQYLSPRERTFVETTGSVPPRTSAATTGSPSSRTVRNVTPNQALEIIKFDPEWNSRSPEEQIAEANRLATMNKLPGGGTGPGYPSYGGNESIQNWSPNRSRVLEPTPSPRDTGAAAYQRLQSTGATGDGRIPIPQWKYDRAVRDLGQQKADRYYVVR